MRKKIVILLLGTSFYACSNIQQPKGGGVVRYLAESNEQEFHHLDSLKRHLERVINIDFHSREMEMVQVFHPQIQQILFEEGYTPNAMKIRDEIRQFLEEVDYKGFMHSRRLVRGNKGEKDDLFELAQLERKLIEYTQLQLFNQYLSFVERESVPYVYSGKQDTLFVGLIQRFNPGSQITFINGKPFKGADTLEDGFILLPGLKYPSMDSMTLKRPKISLEGGFLTYKMDVSYVHSLRSN